MRRLDASTGALVSVISRQQYHFASPDALALSGGDLFVADQGGNSITEINAGTGALLRVISGLAYRFS